MSHCRGCRAEIVWATVAESGKKIPLNPGIDYAGNVYYTDHAAGLVAVLSPERAMERRMAEQTLHMPHHATCPAVEEFRRGRDDG